MRAPQGRKKSRDRDTRDIESLQRNGYTHLPPAHTYSALPTAEQDDDRVAKGLSMASMKSAAAVVDDNIDQVRFAEDVCFCTEGEDFEVHLDLLRFGNCFGTSTVSYCTEDGSAKAGIKYVAKAGELIFKPGECRQKISIAILNDNICDPTSEFGVKLQALKGCKLATRAISCRVKVIDLDAFPTVRGGEYLKESTGWALIGLMREYFRRILWVPGLGWRAFVHFLFGQLYTWNFLLQIWMSKYIVDVLFNDDPETVHTQLWFGSREWTGFILALLFIVPQSLIHCTDLLRCKMDLAGHTLEFLQRALYRKSLDWSEQARTTVKKGTLGHFLVAEAGVVCSLYMNVLHLMRVSTKIFLTMVVFFRERKAYAIPVLLFPSLAVLLGRLFWRPILDDSDSVSVGKESIMSIMHTTTTHKTLINDYMQRPRMNTWMAQATQDLQKNAQIARLKHMNIGFCFPHLSGFICAFYILSSCTGFLGMAVGAGSAGDIVAMVQLVLSLGEDFKMVFELIIMLIDACSSLRTYCTLMNLPCDSVDKKRLNSKRMEVMRQHLDTWESQMKSSTERVSMYEYTNLLSIDIRNLRFDFPDVADAGFKSDAFRIDHLSFAQGTMSCVHGPLGSGKNTLIKILGDVLHPQSGLYFAPPHLNCLHVDNDTRDSMVFKDSLWHNLTFGSKQRKHSVNRVSRILRRFDSQKLRKQFEMEQANGFECESAEMGWWDALSNGEFAIINLARALVSDPHMLVIEHPFKHFNEDTYQEMLKVLQEFVLNRGMEAEGSLERRRPHTCIYSTRNPQEDLPFVHQVVYLDMNHGGGAVKVVPGGLGQSWSANNHPAAGGNSVRAPRTVSTTNGQQREKENGSLDPVILL